MQVLLLPAVGIHHAELWVDNQSGLVDVDGPVMCPTRKARPVDALVRCAIGTRLENARLPAVDDGADVAVAHGELTQRVEAVICISSTCDDQYLASLSSPRKRKGAGFLTYHCDLDSSSSSPRRRQANICRSRHICVAISNMIH